MAEITENTENPNFRLKAIAEFLDGNHHFYIPSYQRGYRWDKKQVVDLLKDISDFASKAKQGEFYCLQPIVVKSKEWKNVKEEEIQGWEVIDGQQRLTTILLLLKYLRNNSDDAKNSSAKFFDVFYKTRPSLDFDNPQKENDIDSYHAYTTKQTIELWFKENTVKKSKLVEVLFDDYSEENKTKEEREWEPQVKFIWYVATNDKDIDSIKVFNNLNKGKIGLTNAELIKALFVLKAQETKNDKKVEELNLNEFSYEWNEIENSLHDNQFWYFLTNKDYNPATRIDIIFDFLTSKSTKAEADFAYRQFQNFYDNTPNQLWVDKNINNFTEAWKNVKEVFQTFIYWYEDSTLYHYIGFLIYYKVPLSEIFEKCIGIAKSEVVNKLQELIRTKILTFQIADINEFSYSENSDKEKLFKTLLFFNVETCVKQQKNQNRVARNIDNTSYYKFPFDLFKLNQWDIEHVGSQKDNPLKDIKDKIIWLNYIEHIDSDNKEWPKLKEEASELSKALSFEKKDNGDKFKQLYDKIYSIIQPEANADKDTIENLTLLDAGTNRGYGNALFPSKRQIIIENDTKGIFIPPCTKNLFLKYYSNKDTSNSQWKNSWENTDRKAYLDSIHQVIDFILN